MSESLRDRVARVLYEVATAGFTEVPSFDDAHEFDKADHYVAADALIAAGLVAEFTPDDFEVAATAVALEEGSISAPKGGRAWRLASAALNAVRNYREVTS